jgi:hypothetical protein
VRGRLIKKFVEKLIKLCNEVLERASNTMAAERQQTEEATDIPSAFPPSIVK